jgi:hypothetical protein
MEYVIARLELGRDAAALRRHKGLSSGKSAKGWNAKPRELSERTITLRGWDSDRDTALAIYTRLVFPGRHHVPELDGWEEPTMDDVIAAREAAERDALLATF